MEDGIDYVPMSKWTVSYTHLDVYKRQMLGLSALVEAHDEREVQMAVDAKSRIIGVNNRKARAYHKSECIHDSVLLKESNRLQALRMPQAP